MRTPTLLLALTLAACGDKGEDTATSDADADGFPAGIDCDDDDPAIHPDAVEVCDGGIDNNCDGLADGRHAADAESWWIDLDGDGYGDTLYPRLDCEQPEGHVGNSGDCDDTSASINPAGEEDCNGLDDDCDGLTDEDAVTGPTWYRDADGDGYGDEADTVVQCTEPSGYTDEAGDCDDTADTVNPGAAETWYDGIDADCAGDSDYDQDGDGYDADAFGGDDCDDTDSAIRPGVTEHCDGIDEDCNGLVDDDPIVAPTWFLDGDGDGQGRATERERACEAPDDYVDNALDCDDTDPAIYDGAPEVWYDGVDGDCGGDSDYDQDGDGYDADAYGGDDCDDTDAARYPRTWYADADGDGYGDASSTLSTCDAPSDYVVDATDCDDTTDLANPGLTEVCGDGIDNDCDGGATGCGLLGDTQVGGSAVPGDEQARLHGDAVNDLSGSASLIPGDTDGDGVLDLVVASTEAATGGAAAGAIYLVLGVPTGTVDLLADGLTLYGSAGDAVGGALAGEDTDGDGYADLLVGGTGAGSGAGGAWLLRGPLTSSGDLSSAAAATYTGASATSAAGGHLALGELTGDADVDAVFVSSGDGAVYLEAGPLSGAATLGGGVGAVTGLSTASTLLVAAGLDLDGDGQGDLVVSDSGAAVSGQSWVFFGPISGELTAADADAVIQGSSGSTATALSSAGDLDGDGLEDILWGSAAYDGCGSNCGGAWAVFGPATGVSQLSSADVRVSGGAAGDELGAAAVTADIDGDDVLDLIVGAPGAGSGGELSIFVGPLSGALGSASADGTVSAAAAADDLGESLSAGDLDADGFDDLLTGAPRYNGGAINSGGAFLLLGGAGL